MIKFGDVFKHKELDYVYLAATSEIVYAARILNKHESGQILNLSNKNERGRNHGALRAHPLFCFVVLKTKEFEDRMAHFQKTQNGVEDFLLENVFASLDISDLRQIKDEIIHKESPVPKELKEIIKNIDI